MHIQAAGLRHHITRQGQGSPVVMLHGLLVGSLASWYFTAAPALAAHHEVICTDLRGHGRSEAVASGFDLATLSADLIAVLDALELPGPVDLVGHSYGGLVALHTALHHPARVRRLVLVDAPLPPADPGLLGAHEGATAEELVAMLPEAQRGVLAGGGRRATRFLQGLAQLLSTTLLADLAAEPPLHDEALRGLSHPVSLVYGTRSACRADGARLAATLPRATLTLLDGGHFLPLEAAPALTTHLVEALHG